MANTSLAKCLSLVFMLSSSFSAEADMALGLSKLDISAQNAEVIVKHHHAITRDREAEALLEESGFVLKYDSTLTFFLKATGEVYLEIDIGPLTQLVNVDGGPYFVGLSQLKTLSYKYNFLLFNQEGDVLAEALVTRDSGHCHTLGGSVTNWIYWFDQDSPDVRLVLDEDGESVRSVIVGNPYDESGGEGAGACVFDVSPYFTPANES